MDFLPGGLSLRDLTTRLLVLGMLFWKLRCRLCCVRKVFRLSWDL